MAAVIRITPAQAESIARRHYGAGGRAQRLASEHDDAFRIVAGDGSSRLLKIGQPEPGAGSAPELPSFQASVLLHLAETAPELPVQRVMTTLDGAPEVLLPASTGPARLARMTSWLDGSLLGRCAATPELRREIGGTLARLNRALRGFSHPGARRTHQWDLPNFGRLDAEGLPANAATTGGYLKDAVTRLASGSPVLGHVRGGRGSTSGSTCSTR